MTTANSLDNIKTFESWAQDYYEPIALKHYDKAIARMLQYLAPPPGGTVFDGGCGTGVHSIRTAKAGFRVQSIDISAVVVEEAKSNASKAGVSDKIEFEQGDLTKLRFADASFDAVFSWGVIIHIPEIDKAMAELVRVLKPGGRIALQVTNQNALDHKIEGVARFLLRKPEEGQEKQRWGVGGWCDMHGGKLFNWKMNIKEMTREMEKLGCKKIHRSCSEFTELQRRTGGIVRNLLRRMNNAWFDLGLPAGPACTNVLIFEKAKA